MGRTIKLLLYFFAYQLAFMGVAVCGYMLYQGSYEVPQTPDSLYTNLIMLAQILSTAAVGIHRYPSVSGEICGTGPEDLGVSPLTQTVSNLSGIYFSNGLMDQLLQ